METATTQPVRKLIFRMQIYFNPNWEYMKTKYMVTSTLTKSNLDDGIWTQQERIAPKCLLASIEVHVENMASDNFCSHFLQKGRIDLIYLPDCCIFIAVSINTHIVIWRYGHILTIWPYGHIDIRRRMASICLCKQLKKCSNLAKELRWLDIPVKNESENGLMAYFLLYFSEFPLYMQKYCGHSSKCPKTHDIFGGGS